MPLTFVSDLLDEFDWDTITEESDNDGTLITRTITYDDGRHSYDEYIDGLRDTLTVTVMAS
jgi:hypothetical protein